MNTNALKTLVDLTRQRERRAAEISLVNAIAEAIEVTSVMLLRPPYADNADHFDVAVNLAATSGTGDTRQYQLLDEPVSIERDDALVDCFDNGHSLSVDVGSHSVRTLIPTRRGARVDGVVCIESTAALAEQQQTIEMIVAIFSNHQSLISDFEQDALTGLLNRRAFDTRFAQMLREQRQSKQTLVGTPQVREKRYAGPDSTAWLAILDIDHFKLVNDTFGHLFGDEVILAIAQKMREYFRNSDLLFRFGGDEFIAILEPTPVSMAQLTLERFRRQIANHKFPQLGRLTISVGFTRVAEHDYPAHILECADQALYYAKASGRNRVCEYADLVKRGRLRDEQLSGSIELY